MKAALRMLLSRWAISLAGTLLLVVLVWLFGPLLPLLEGWVPRVIIVSLMLAVWAGVNFLLDWRKRQRDTELTAGLAGDLKAAASAEEVAALSEKLTTALALLKRARGSRGYLYEQPWYAIIGPPGAGKTTALLNAGLRFPLAAEMGQGAVAGVGGTRNCDWWFTEDAVLIDTAGRYITQDSDAAVDRAGWDAFLSLLKRTRPRQPLNGVLVAISVSDIAQDTAEEGVAHARAIRRRVKELDERLGRRLPVYVLFTKADLVAGFSEFFDDLDRERRDQVWGMTFPLGTGEAGPSGTFAAEFRLLIERLDARLFDRLQTERSPDRRAAIAGFPAQVASLEAPMAAFLQEAFGGSRLDPAPLLRGVYFTSGTQDGTPIDRLTGVLARAFGLDQRRAPSLRPTQGRSYFLGRLLREVVFGEAMLVSERPGAARRGLLLRAGAFAAIGLLTLGAGVLVWRAREAGQQQVDSMVTAVAAYERTGSGLPLDPVADADLPRLVGLLDQARALQPGGNDAEADAAPWWLAGLRQEVKLAAGAKAAYRHALGYALLPRLVWRLEAQMRGNLNRPDFLYEATRVYLMLGGEGPLDPALVREWMALDWQAAYPGATSAPLRTSLSRHLDALLAEPLPSVTLDGELVAQGRTTFSRVPLAQRVYSRIRPSAAAQRLPSWRPTDALGAAGARVFSRASGVPLTEGIPGFYTLDGFHKVLLPALGNAAKEIAGESWVLGQRSEVDPNGPEMRAIERDVIALYEAEYAQVWDSMLLDLNVVPLRSLSQAAQDLYILSSPQSPMRDLLASAARQLTLSMPPAAAAGAPATASPVPPASNERLQAVLGTAQPGEAPPAPGRAIDERYKPLRDLVGSGAGAPIDQVLKSLNDLQQQLAKMAAAPISGGAPPVPTGYDPALALRAEAQRQPQPLSRWLLSMAAASTVLRGGGARQQVAAAFNGAGGPAALCPAAVSGRFPFTPGAANEIPLDDFGKLFAPGGLLDGFLNTQLKPYVDMSVRPWKPQPADGVPAPVSPADLAQFERAASIRDLFFAAGSATPTVRFDITPVSLDSGARQVILDLDGTTIAYANGPPRATQVTWPGATRMQNVRMVFDPPPAGSPAALTETGPWAMFRLFGRGRLQQAGARDRYTLTFQIADRQAVFELRAGSVLNPFAPGMLQEFRCPTVR